MSFVNENPSSSCFWEDMFHERIFEDEFGLSASSSESSPREEEDLLPIINQDPLNELPQLLERNTAILKDFEDFYDHHLNSLVNEMKYSLRSAGKVFFVGFGSCAQTALHLADKERFDNQVLGICEKKNDTIEWGEKCAANLNLSSYDIVILISKNKSNFNSGFGMAAKKENAKIFDFQNTKYADKDSHFHSTILAELCLGTALEMALNMHLYYAAAIKQDFSKALDSIKQKFDVIKEIIKNHVEVFSSPFEQLHPGSVGYLSLDQDFRRVLSDAAQHHAVGCPIQHLEPKKYGKIDNPPHLIILFKKIGLYDETLPNVNEALDRIQTAKTAVLFFEGIAESEISQLKCTSSPLILEKIPFDQYGTIPTVTLKVILYLFSKGALVLTNKIKTLQKAKS